MKTVQGVSYMLSLTCVITEDMPYRDLESVLTDLSLVISGIQYRLPYRDIEAVLSIVLMSRDKTLWRLTTNAKLYPVHTRGGVIVHDRLQSIREAIMKLIHSYRYQDNNGRHGA